MTKVVIKAADGTGAVESYHNANKKLETTSAGVTVTGNIAVTGTVDGRDLATDGTKLDGIEASATADQTNAEIRAAVEAATDSNVFTDADHTKLNGIASSATNVGGATGVDFNDNVKVRFGTSNDLEIYHDGTSSNIVNNTSWLMIKNDDSNTSEPIYLRPKGDENSVILRPNGAVELYYDHAKKLETTSGGVSFNDTNITNVGSIALDSIKGDGDDDTNITFAGSDTITVKCGSTSPALTINTTQVKVADSQKFVAGTGNDLEIYHDSNNSVIDNKTNDLYIKSVSDVFITPGTTEAGVYIRHNGSVELYYDNVKKLHTKSTGVRITGHLELSDSEIIKLGANSDLQIYHDGSNSYIQEDGTGQIIIRGWAPEIQAGFSPTSGRSTGETAVKAITDGAVELYHNAIKTFETYDRGITVYGPEGDHGEVYIYADEGDDDADKWLLQSNTAGTFYLKNFADGSWETSIKAGGGGNVELYYNNSKKFETTSAGVEVTGTLVFDSSISGGTITLQDDQKLFLGAGNDLQLYHNGTYNVLDANTGYLKITASSSALYLQSDTDVWITTNNAGETMAKFSKDAGVHLYHNNVEKVRTTADGLTFNGDTAAANALDDYEEGEFTLSYSANFSGDASWTKGWYTKIGSEVTARFYINCTAVSGSDVLTVDLPFTSAANSTNAVRRGLGPVMAHLINVPANVYNIVTYCAPGATYARWYMSVDNGSWTSLLNSHLSTSSDMHASITYSTL